MRVKTIVLAIIILSCIIVKDNSAKLDKTNKRELQQIKGTITIYINNAGNYMTTHNEDIKLFHYESFTSITDDANPSMYINGVKASTPLTKLKVGEFNPSGYGDTITFKFEFKNELKTAYSLFEDCDRITKIIFTGFTTSQITMMNNMFYDCLLLETVDFGDLNTGKVTHMHQMFADCTSLNSVDLSKLDTSKVEIMSDLFHGAKNLRNVNVSTWDTGSATSMEELFRNCEQLTSIDLTNWDTRQITSTSGLKCMFENAINLKSIKFGPKFTCENAKSIDQMFNNTRSLTSLDLSTFKTAQLTDMDSTFANMASIKFLDLSVMNLTNVQTLRYLFANNTQLETLKMYNFEGKACTNISGIFSNCISLKYVAFNDFNPTAIKSTDYMFENCANLQIIDFPVADFSTMLSAEGMFKGCTSLVSLDMSHWKLNSGSYASMFEGCTKLKYVNFGTIQSNKVKSFKRMFYGCKSIQELDFSTFTLTSLTFDSFESAFENCENLLQVKFGSGFKIKPETSFKNAFKGCTLLMKPNLESLDVTYESTTVVDFENAFVGCNNLHDVNLNKLTTFADASNLAMFQNCQNIKVTTSDSTIYAKLKQENSCLEQACDPATPYKEGSECKSSCTSGKKKNGYSCEGSCPTGTVLDGDNCISSCKLSATNKYNLDNVCVSSCATQSKTYTEGNKCVSSCSSGKLSYIAGKQCVDSCDELSSAKIQIGTTCNDHCTDYQFGAECKTNCPEGTYSYETGGHKYCYYACEPSITLTKTHHYKNTCSDSCNELYQNGDHDCVSTCPYGSYKATVNGKNICVTNCETNGGGKKYNYTGICSDSCKDLFMDGYKCHEKCPGSKYGYTISDTNKKCVSDCATQAGNNKYSVGKDCTPSCMSWFDYGGMCVEQCAEIYLGKEFINKPDDKKCLDSCSDASLYTTDKVYEYKDYYCERTCRDLILYNDECRTSCPSGLKIFNRGPEDRTCIDSCEHTPIPSLSYKNTCDVKCNDYIARGNTCVETCEDNEYVYIYKEDFNNKTCKTDCSQTDKPYKYIDQNLEETTYVRTCQPDCKNKYAYGYDCVDSCPTGTFISEDAFNPANKMCVTNCQSAHKLYIDGKCTDFCPGNQVRNDYTCLDECPQDKYLYENGINKTCVTDCSATDKKYKYNKKCVSDCKDRYLVDDTCKTSCPEGYYQYQGEENNLCVQDCSQTSLSILDENKCVSYCPDPKRAYLGNCVDSCPAEYFIYEEQGGYTCVDSCSNTDKPMAKGQYCVEKCENGYKRLGNNCVQECPAETDSNGDCIDPCEGSANKYYNNGKCLSKAESTNLGLFTYDFRCISECPPGTIPCEETKECFRDCKEKDQYRYNYFGKCKSSCQESYSDEDYKCLSECPSGMYIIEANHTCVDKCSGNLPFINGRKCVADCSKTKNKLTKEGKCVAESEGWKSAGIALIVISLIILGGLIYFAYKYFTTKRTSNGSPDINKQPEAENDDQQPREVVNSEKPMVEMGNYGYRNPNFESQRNLRSSTPAPSSQGEVIYKTGAGSQEEKIDI